MKKVFVTILIAAAAVASVLSSCQKNPEGEEGVKKYNLTVKLAVADSLLFEDLGDKSLTLSYSKGADSKDVPIDTAGVILELPQGTYSLSVSGKLSPSVSLSGAASVELYQDAEASIELTQIMASPLIFRAIYSCCGIKGYTRDNFFEIVNNSDEVQYLDQLVLLYASAAQKAPNAWQATGVTDIYYQGQGPVVAFPGGGTDYPIQPGKSVVIANDATNHKEADPDGADNHSDLSKADWEIYLDYSKMGDVDFEAPNLSAIFYNNQYMRAFGLGFFNGAYVLAKLPVTPEAYAAEESSYSTTPGTTSATKYMGIPSKYVLDAVEAWENDESEHYSYFLPKDDAHAVWAAEGWSGKCIRRKVAKIEDGRVYYKDTNNSSEDFLTGQPQTPGVAPTAVD